MKDLPTLRAFCEQGGFPLDDGQVSAFLSYRDALYRANATANLTRVAVEDCEVRHFVDSLLVAEFCPRNARVLDLGTGPGLPAWPLACARPDLCVTALDSSHKMLAVLQACPLPNLVAKNARAEEVDERERYDVVTGRAVAPLAVQAELSAAWLKVGGAFVPFRTPKDRLAAFSRLGLKLERKEERPLPGTDVVRVFPVYRKVKPTPKRFPRTWAQIRASARPS